MGADIVAVFNMFLDPAAAVKRIDSKYIWMFPLALLGIISAAIGWLTVPLTMQILLRNPPEGMSREAFQQALPNIQKFSQIGVFATPIIIVVMTLLLALLLYVACQVTNISAKFGQLFNLISMASIIKAVNALAAFVVIKLKGNDINSIQDLSPPLGLDMFLPDDANKILFATLNFFSLFQIWFIIALALGLAAFTRSSKGKAFAAVTPVWVCPLLFAIIGAMFRKN